MIFTDYMLDEGETGADFVLATKKLYTKHKVLHPTFILVSGMNLQDDPKAELFFKCILKPFSFDSFSLELNRWLDIMVKSKLLHPLTKQANPQD